MERAVFCAWGEGGNRMTCGHIFRWVWGRLAILILLVLFFVDLRDWKVTLLDLWIFLRCFLKRREG